MHLYEKPREEAGDHSEASFGGRLRAPRNVKDVLGLRI